MQVIVKCSLNMMSSDNGLGWASMLMIELIRLRNVHKGDYLHSGLEDHCEMVMRHAYLSMLSSNYVRFSFRCVSLSL